MSLTIIDLVGRGWAFPPQLDNRGGVALTTIETEIQQAMYIILSTAPGERVMRPDFGCRIHEYIFAPANSSTMGEVEEAVREALNRWEPRINLRDVIVSANPGALGALLIEVKYVIKATNDLRSVVYPFYLMH